MSDATTDCHNTTYVWLCDPLCFLENGLRPRRLRDIPNMLGVRPSRRNVSVLGDRGGPTAPVQAVQCPASSSGPPGSSASARGLRLPHPCR